MSVQAVAGNGFVVVGALLVAAAAVGMLRLPDVYSRTNAVTKAAALGVCCVLLGVLILLPSVVTAVTLVLAVAAQLFTAPITGYAVGRAAYRSGVPFMAATHRNDLRDRPPPR